jgi:formate dehydrogenase iron-sulfur subunit
MKRISRRSFFKAGTTAALSGMLGCKSAPAQARAFSGYAHSKGVLVDLTRCIGCRSCEAACNKEQGLPAPATPFTDQSVFADTGHLGHRRPDDKAYTVVDRTDSPLADHPLFRKIQCNHCLEPSCLTACFVNAYTKTEQGAVIYDPSVCVGCRTCMVACPFSIPAFRYDSALHPRIMKCQFCYETRLQYDRPPACVEACPRDALTFGERESLLRIARHRIRTRPDEYVNHIYGEHEAGGTSWLYLSPVPFAEAGFDTTVPTEPIINYVKDFLAIVPMVLTIWPALFAGFHLLARRNRVQPDNADTEKSDE